MAAATRIKGRLPHRPENNVAAGVSRRTNLPPYGGSYIHGGAASKPSRKWPHTALDSTLRLISDLRFEI